jgi:hypothetical protein
MQPLVHNRYSRLREEGTMRARNWLLLAGVGAGAYLYYSGQGRQLMQTINARMEDMRQQRATRELSTMLDDVVHRDDIPETPVKQAFEHAVHEQLNH